MSFPEPKQPETGKQRALRIPLDYHRAWDTVRWWKTGLTVLSLVAAVVYVAWVCSGNDRAKLQTSHGPVANPHAGIENRCGDCHVPFQPIREDAFGLQALNSFLRLAPADDPRETPAAGLASGTARDPHRDLIDKKCSKCHAGPIHHQNQKPAEIASCASCHTDHRGRLAQIGRPDDSHCTNCHANIGKHLEGDKSSYPAPLKDVATFSAATHPEFRPLANKQSGKPSDPGNIKFSHGLHMAAGQLYPGMKPSAAKTLEKLLPEFREQYAPWAGKDGIIQLDCAACHQAVAADSTNNQSAAGGEYMQPIRFEQHCRACHPLTIPGLEKSSVPHALRGKQLEAAVRGAVEMQENAAPLSPNSPVPTRPIPGKTPRDNISDNLPLVSPAVVGKRLGDLRQAVCTQCHTLEKEDVLPSKIPEVWLNLGRFDHAAHRQTACGDCHAGALAALPASILKPTDLLDHDEVFIPGIKNCVTCHAPPAEVIGTSAARFDCVECHRYHGRVMPGSPVSKEGK